MSGSVSVVSVRGLSGSQRQGIVYVGRACAGWSGSALGNPFPMRGEGQRQQVIAQFKRHLWAGFQVSGSPIHQAVMSLVQRVKAGEHVVLGCWCCPKQCHGHVIAALVMWVVSGGVK